MEFSIEHRQFIELFELAHLHPKFFHSIIDCNVCISVVRLWLNYENRKNFIKIYWILVWIFFLFFCLKFFKYLIHRRLFDYRRWVDQNHSIGNLRNASLFIKSFDKRKRTFENFQMELIRILMMVTFFSASTNRFCWNCPIITSWILTSGGGTVFIFSCNNLFFWCDCFRSMFSIHFVLIHYWDRLNCRFSVLISRIKLNVS